MELIIFFITLFAIYAGIFLIQNKPLKIIAFLMAVIPVCYVNYTGRKWYF